MSAHKLEVEQGRYYNVAKNQRMCKMCSKSEIEDEFRFLLVCPCYDNFRKNCIKKYYYEKPSTYNIISSIESFYNKTMINILLAVQMPVMMKITLTSTFGERQQIPGCYYGVSRGNSKAFITLQPFVTLCGL
jgi:hypothetical protein